jgi:ATP-dependent DNA ligase
VPSYITKSCPEVKLNGYRGIAVFDAGGKPHLWSRNGLPLEQKFPAVAKALSKLKLRSTILDGEVVAVDENGIPRFQLLQRFQKQPTAPTLYYIFDILWNDGEDITSNLITERRQVLERVLKFLRQSKCRCAGVCHHVADGEPCRQGCRQVVSLPPESAR